MAKDITRRQFLKITGGGLLGLYVGSRLVGTHLPGFEAVAYAQIPGGTLDPTGIPKYVTPLLVPPVMPRAGTVRLKGGKNADYYEISVRQIQQQILPTGYGKTTVWGYGAVKSASKRGLLIHNAPSLTIEAQWKRPVRIKWINELKDANGNYLPHLLPVDPTLHWANPGGGPGGTDIRPDFSGKTYVPLAEFTDPATQYTQYIGPVPMVTHVHGAVGVSDESDGYTEAWYLPAAHNIPAGYATEGTWYRFFKSKAAAAFRVRWGRGYAVFQYPNSYRAATVWYHDHTLGMTGLNVYAGPAGFYIIRGGPSGDSAVDSRTGKQAVLPGPAPRAGDPFPSKKAYYEVPIAVQDRAFNSDGSLFYPNSREFFGDAPDPISSFIPQSDVSPIHNPEFFGNCIMVNGTTWPKLTVEARRYRLRFLNGCDSRTLVLKFDDPRVKVWQIGNEGGFLAAPVDINAAPPDPDVADSGKAVWLMGNAERADLIVDFSCVRAGTQVKLLNVGSDAPFGGFPIEEVADPESTGQVMRFDVVTAVSADLTTPPRLLRLPAIAPLPAAIRTRKLALTELTSPTFGDVPVETRLGTVAKNGDYQSLKWMDPVTETPAVGDTEIWEFYNTTVDAHPMHIHEVEFEVVSRQALLPITNQNTDAGTGNVRVDPSAPVRGPQPWEKGRKDTVIALPGEVTRVKATFSTPGQFVWHCHIVEHEDNEMMRPFRIGPVQPGQPA
jgi:FtsP/CotA-like multicopper oxidase with cupredoxin domain